MASSVMPSLIGLFSLFFKAPSALTLAFDASHDAFLSLLLLKLGCLWNKNSSYEDTEKNPPLQFFCSKRRMTPQSYSMLHCTLCLLWTQGSLWLRRCWITRRCWLLFVYNNLSTPCVWLLLSAVYLVCSDDKPWHLCFWIAKNRAQWKSHADRPHNRISSHFSSWSACVFLRRGKKITAAWHQVWNSLYSERAFWLF